MTDDLINKIKRLSALLCLNNFKIINRRFIFIALNSFLLSTLNLYAEDETINFSQQNFPTQTVNKINSLEEVNQLLDVQNQQLKEIQKNAEDTLYFNGGLPKDKPSTYCKKIWQALMTQDRFDIPKPVMLANNESEKTVLYKSLFVQAKNNFNRYLSQKGNLTPKNYKDHEGKVWTYGPYNKTDSDRLNKLKDLPNKFNKSWQSNPYSVLASKGLFNENLTMLLLYLPPFPVKGYQQPLVISLLKDQCEGCTGLSTGLQHISVDGLLQPEFGNGEMFSKNAYMDALAQYEKHNQMKLAPNPPYLLMGLANLNHQLVFWKLNEQTLEEPKATPAIGYYKAGDAAKYFRRYMLDLTILQGDEYSGLHNACSVSFN